MDLPVGDVAGLFVLERTRLLELLHRLNHADWSRPTSCPGWTVLGLTCHLLGDDLGFLSRNRDEFLGTPPPDNLEPGASLDISGDDRVVAEIPRTRAIIGRPK